MKHAHRLCDRRQLVPVAMLLGIAWLTSGPSAQGLGDVAKREAARRQQVTGGKKYTNENLPAVADAVPASPAASAGAGESATSAGGGEPKSGSAQAGSGAAAPAAEAGQATFDPKAAGIKSAEEKRGEQFWRDKAGAVRSEMDKANAKVAGLKKRLDGLEAQLSGGAGTSHVQEREVTLKALEKAQYNAKSMREEWDRLEARATAAKVPAEWLR